MIDDAQLLRRYAEERSERAFSELVQRHVDLVFAAALRRVGGDQHLAEEVTQTVFTHLASKAAALVNHPVLIGWLHRSTYFAALDAVRDRARRERRERPLDSMNDIPPAKAETVDWAAVRPEIDSLLDELNERDRGALLLRFFEGRSFSEIGARLDVTEDAARMRVERALEKIRGLLARRGVRSTGAALGVVLARQAGIAAPAGLAASVAGAALAGANVSGAGLGSAGIFFIMGKIKIGIWGVVTAVSLATAVIEVRANRGLRTELQALRADSADLERLERESRQTNVRLQQIGERNSEAGELARLRGRLAVLKARPSGVTDAAMKPASTWRNAGRATPEATWETLCHAVSTGDLAGVAGLLVFRDDTKEDRTAFMTRLTDAMRARYATPEQVCAAALFPVVADPGRRAPDDAYQVLGVDEIGFDRVRVRIWIRQNGHEYEGRDSYSRTPDGWSIALRSLNDASLLELVNARLDPATGEVRREKKP